MHQEKIEIIKLFCYLIFLFLFLVIGNFVGQEFINHDAHVHRMMYIVQLIYLCLNMIYCVKHFTI